MMSKSQKLTTTALWIATAMLGCSSDPVASGPDAAEGVDAPGVDAAVDAKAPTFVALTMSGRPADPVATSFIVAYQDGDGPWQLAAPPAGDTYSLSVESGRYGIAYTCNQAFGVVNLGFFATSEYPALTIPLACGSNPAASISGTFVNGAASGRYDLTFGGVTAYGIGAGGMYESTVYPGTRDLVVQRTVANVGAESLVVRDLQVTTAATVALDMSLVAATRTADMTVDAPGATSIQATTMLVTKNHTTAQLNFQMAAPFVGVFLPAAQASPDDLYQVRMQVVQGGQIMAKTNIVNQPTAQTFAPFAVLGTVSASIATTAPTPLLSSQWAAYPDALGYLWFASQSRTMGCGGMPTCGSTWTAVISTGWLGAAATSFTMPDLSTLAGWHPNFDLGSGAAVNGLVQAISYPAGTGPIGDLLDQRLVLGSERRVVSARFTITP